jgi:hypothetical protein
MPFIFLIPGFAGKQFPGDFGAVGARSIVGQSFILLNAKTHFLPAG